MVGIPDLSGLQLGRRMSCDSADLYFVVLGACGVCRGGKSIVCGGDENEIALWRAGVLPFMPDWEPEGCNNTCEP